MKDEESREELKAENEQARRELFKMPVTYGGTDTLSEMVRRVADELAERTLTLDETRAERDRLRAFLNDCLRLLETA